MLKRLLFFLLLALLGATVGHAQQVPTTQGTEFWVSFMRNGYRNSQPNPQTEKVIMIASAKRGCTVTVRNPNQNWEDSFTVGDNSVNTFRVEDIRGYNDQQAGISNKGILVTSTDTISLYIANEADNSYDAANVLPIQALGTSYMVQSNKSIGEQSSHTNENRASFLIVATQDDTQIRITPTCETWDNHSAGRPYTVTLQTGECYHVLNKNQGTTSNSEGDFSGTTIESLDETKPIAVFNGNCITSIPGGTTSGFDHVFEQAMPVDHWGKRFVVTCTNAPSYFNLLNDMVKITALYDNTTVWRDGVELQHLNGGESLSFEMDLNTEPCTYLESDSPIAVYLYNHSHRQATSGSTYGDPSMVWISPVEQNIREITFSTFQAANVQKHYVNVVCYTSSVPELTYDNNPISNSFTMVPSAPEFSYARVEVPIGAHTIRCPGGLVAHVYGMGPNEGYAYTVGSSAKTLTNQLFVNDELVTEYTTCRLETLQFRLETNYEPDRVVWNFGDGSPTEEGTEVEHTYNTEGDFGVTVSVSHEVNGIPLTTTVEAAIHVNPLNEYWITETTCEPFYTFHGENYQVPLFQDLTFPSNEGCDTIYHMNIMEGSSSSYTFYDTACMEYEWFDTIRYESGTYIVIVNQEGGCDSLYILNLTIGKPPENPVRTKYSCSPYLWDNRILCDTTGTYRLSFTNQEHCVYDSILHFVRVTTDDYVFEKDTCDQYEWLGRIYHEIGSHTYDTIITGDDGCETHFTLHLTLHQSPSFDDIKGLSNVAVATNFWPGQYVYYLDDSTGIDVSRIQWELLGNPEGPDQWDIVPHGASCTITAYSMGERELRVSSGDGPCDKVAVKTINCSGYGVGEEQMANLEVYPNPVKDELTVKGPEMMELNLYSLLGQKVSTVQANGDTEVKIKVNDLPQALYLLEVRTKKGNKTRLVSVIK